MYKIKTLKRNGAFFDIWSITHMFTAASLCLLVGPFWAFVITVLWEPFELFIVSPLFAKIGIVFGYETIRNSLSDIVFDAVGVGLALFLLKIIV